jgi:hypothetical protein
VYPRPGGGVSTLSGEAVERLWNHQVSDWRGCHGRLTVSLQSPAAVADSCLPYKDYRPRKWRICARRVSSSHSSGLPGGEVIILSLCVGCPDGAP